MKSRELIVAGLLVLTGLGTPACRKTEEKKVIQDGGTQVKTSRPKPAGDHEGDLFQVPLGDSPRSGPADALVTAVFFGDFSDQASRELFGHLQRLRLQQERSFRWVFKNFPRYPKPELALEAARLACLAADGSRFEAFADGLFGRKANWNRSDLMETARQAGLKIPDIKRALQDDPFKKRVIGDRRLAVRLGVKYAPAVFLNGRRFRINSFQDLVDRFGQEKQQAESLLGQGVTADRLYQELTRRGKRSAWLVEHPPLKAVQARNSPDQKATAPAVQKRERVSVDPGPGPGLGPRDARVQLVVFADLECTFCAQMISRFRGLQEKHPKQLRISLRQLPAVHHKELRDVEVALVAAAGQKNSWSFVEKVYANHRKLDRRQVLTWAKELGLNESRIRRHVEQPAKMDAVLESNLSEAKRVGVRGRPYLFVQGWRVPGATGLATLERLVEESLQQKP